MKAKPSLRHRKRTKKEQLASALYNLRLDVNDLRQQIHQLCLQRALLLQPQALEGDAHGASLRKVATLFGVFNQGYRGEVRAPRDFTAMLTGGSPRLFEFWRYQVNTFASRQCEIHKVHLVATHDDAPRDDPDATAYVIRVEATNHGVMTTQALEGYYPRALEDPRLTRAIVGRPFLRPIVFHFEFNADGCVVRYEADADMFAALAKTLNDPFRAAAIMQDEPELLDATSDAVATDNEDRTTTTESDFHDDDDDDDEPKQWSSETQQKPVEPTPTRHSLAFLLS